jgi:cytochrome P450
MAKNPIESVIEISAFNPDARKDPHSILKKVREQCPVFHDEANKSIMFSRYEDVQTIVNDRSMWRHPLRTEEGSMARMIVDGEGSYEDEEGMLFMDEPNHSRVRPPIAKAFYAQINRRKIEIEQIIDGVIKEAPIDGQFDLMAEIAVPIPIHVIAHILGVDESRLKEFRAWSEAVILGLNPVRSEDESARLEWGSEALDEYFIAEMEDRRRTPKDDLISDLVGLQADGVPLSDSEVRRNLESLLVGGNLTTTDLIGNGIMLLLTHPSELAKLRQDPSLVGAAVEEILRYDPPVANTSRVIPGDMEVGGCPMHAHQSVWMSLQAANRDPAKFEDPETFNITRERVPHITFGGGAHICIGAPLARIEAKQVLTTILKKYSNIELADQELEWRALPFFRGLEKLLISV